MKREQKKQSDDKDAEGYQLTELVSLEKLQEIQDAFAEANQIASTITDIHGVPITKPSNHSKVCAIIRSSEKGLENCKISGKHLGQIAAQKKVPHQQMCLSIGFTDAAAPIIVNGKHIANWLIGQYQVRDVDEKRVREYAREIEVDEEELVQAFREMPKMSMERFQKILSFLSLMANEISLMGYNYLLTLRQSEELAQVKKRLEDHQATLEQKIADRTGELIKLNRNLKREIQKTRRIQQDQSRLLTAIESAAEGILITDHQGNIIYVNPALEKLTGYSAAELLGKTPRILNSGIQGKDFWVDFWKTLTRGEIWTGRLANKRKDGTIYQEEATVSSVKDESGKIVNYVAVKKDITKDLEMERQIQQMSKLEAIGTLAAGVAHEINTPVQYVSDNTRFINDAVQDIQQLLALQRNLERRVEMEGLFTDNITQIHDLIDEIDLEFLEEEMGKAIDASLDGLDRISTIVKAMKDFSHPGSQDKTPEDINDLVENTVNVSRNEWKYQAEIELDLDRSIPRIPLFAGQIKQVILNLIINAVQAIAEKNEKGQAERGVIRISTCQSAQKVILTVEDNGIGIPEKIIDKIFDPFFTTKTVGKGTGQGLSLAHTMIVDGHGGNIIATSEVGVGTEFTITLPRS